MPKTTDAECEVPKNMQMGAFSNAFRVMQDGEDWFLDFAVYSEIVGHAKVVARVRVREDFLKSIQDRLDVAIQETLVGNKGGSVVSLSSVPSKEPN